MEEMQAVLNFWFGTETEDALTAKTQARLWWSKNESVDAQIRKQFAILSGQAVRGELDTWMETATGNLALVILCDQFPRNMYRNTSQSFAFDAAARRYCEAGLQRQFDQQLRPVERVFFYLPLEHSENLADQDRAVALFDALRATHAAPEVFEGFYQYALRHREVIQRFGRFPHRNLILGRESSEAELMFLSGPGSSF